MRLTKSGVQTLIGVINRGQARGGKLIPFPSKQGNKVIDVLPLIGDGYETWDVLGDSLNTDDPNTTICSGDRIVIQTKCSREQIIGKLCVVCLYGSEMAIKRIFRESDTVLRLESNNDKFPPEFVENGDCEVIGYVEYFLRRP